MGTMGEVDWFPAGLAAGSEALAPEGLTTGAEAPAPSRERPALGEAL
jgi:hypothetical protein